MGENTHQEEEMRYGEYNETNGIVKKYFQSLGYEVDWEMNSRLQEYWHEIYCPKTKKLICQIDFNVPLESIKEDFICWRENRETTSKHNYRVYCKFEDPLMKKLLSKV